MLSENVRKFRLKNNMSQHDLASQVGVCDVTISLIELGKVKDPKIKTLENLSKTLKVTIQDLID